MNKKIHLETVYPDPIEKVWQALTDPAFLSRWLMPANFEAKVGFRYSLQNESYRITGEVLESDGKSRLVYTWEDGESDQPSVVSWNLTPDGGGTRLTLEHVMLEAAAPYVLIETGMNWRQSAQGLAVLLGDAARPPVPMVYCSDEPVTPVLERAGFRQPEREEAKCQA